MNDLLKEILKQGMLINVPCIGKNLILKRLACGLEQDSFKVEIKGDSIHVLSNFYGTSCIVEVQKDRIRFFPNPKVSPYSQMYVIQSCFETFLDDFAEINEAILDLEEQGITVMPIINDISN